MIPRAALHRWLCHLLAFCRLEVRLCQTHRGRLCTSSCLSWMEAWLRLLTLWIVGLVQLQNRVWSREAAVVFSNLNLDAAAIRQWKGGGSPESCKSGVVSNRSSIYEGSPERINGFGGFLPALFVKSTYDRRGWASVWVANLRDAKLSKLFHSI